MKAEQKRREEELEAARAKAEEKRIADAAAARDAEMAKRRSLAVLQKEIELEKAKRAFQDRLAERLTSDEGDGVKDVLVRCPAVAQRLGGIFQLSKVRFTRVRALSLSLSLSPPVLTHSFFSFSSLLSSFFLSLSLCSGSHTRGKMQQQKQWSRTLVTLTPYVSFFFFSLSLRHTSCVSCSFILSSSSFNLIAPLSSPPYSPLLPPPSLSLSLYSSACSLLSLPLSLPISSSLSLPLSPPLPQRSRAVLRNGVRLPRCCCANVSRHIEPPGARDGGVWE